MIRIILIRVGILSGYLSRHLRLLRMAHAPLDCYWPDHLRKKVTKA